MSQKTLELIRKQIGENLYHGASLAIYRNAQWSEYYLGTIDGIQPVEKGLIYDLASVSKVVGVGTVVIFMVNSGALDLDKSLTAYYPDFHDTSVTLRQLLTHTSGIDPYIPNRDEMNAEELRQAINRIRVTEDKDFKYTDINFLLLGFMLERLSGQLLPSLFEEQIFKPFVMQQTSFGPVEGAVPTVKGISDGYVHDPKARVLDIHAGSAGLFSTLNDLEKFCQHYLSDDFAEKLWQNYGSQVKPRSIAWNLDGDWIDHTGYTGPFVMVNRKEQLAAIFLTNRTFEYDDRPLWIERRRLIRDAIKEELKG